jgi:pimeloyl-ACP methyl ester carboxylesterase
MPFATNAVDGVRTYYEDSGGDGPTVLFTTGFMEPLEVAQSSGLARALAADYRLLFADHRGHGRSDKPHDVDAYALATRCGDVVAVLDELGLERSHFIGFSWGARLGFALGEEAPERLLSLVLCGNQPYEWKLDSPLAEAVSAAIAAGRQGGMAAVVETFESALDYRHPEPMRTWVLDNDPAAIEAAFGSMRTEGSISRELASWDLPCLIYVGEADEMHDDAARAAAVIPGATFLSLPGHTHLSAPDEVDALLPHVLDLFRSASARA